MCRSTTPTATATYDDGSLRITHEITSGNEIETAWVNDGTLVTQPYVYDGAGNLVFDGELFYQYDGFNRLAQVNAGTDLDPNDFAASTGRLLDPNTAPVGVRLATFTYDGLGRLIRTVRQDPNDAAEAEDYYYDGVRRIQEVVTDPGDPNTALITRNYVWGPGYVDEIIARRDDVPGQPARLYFLLQDANFNTVALLDAEGAVLAQWQYEPYGQVVAYEADPNAPVTRLGFQGLFFERFYYRTGEALGANPGEPPSDPPLSDSARGLYHVRNRWLDPLHGRFTSRDPVDTALPIVTALASNGDTLAIVVDAVDAQGHFGDGMNLYAFGGANPFRRDALGLSWGMDDDIDDLVSSISGERTAGFGAVAATLSMGIDIGMIIGYTAFSMLPGSAALQLTGMLAMGISPSTEDFVYAGLSLGGAAIIGKFGIKFAIAAGRYLGKLGQRALAWFKRGSGRLLPRGACFTAGTLVLTVGGFEPIERLNIGDRVITTDSPVDVLLQWPADGDVSRWRLIRLTMPNPDGSNDVIEIETLRPESWVERVACDVGRAIWFALPEMGLAGLARVESIGPCPEIEAASGRVILTTVTHLNGYVLRIWLEGLDEPLEPTDTHRLYSEDRADWVPARTLAVGERLRTLGGPVKITRIELKPGVHRVYNIEVETEHSYYVSVSGLLSHNINPCAAGPYGYLKDPPHVRPGKPFSSEQRNRLLGENWRKNGGRLRCDETGEYLTAGPGFPNSAEIDHIVPRSQGGTNSYGNARVVSRTVNRSKGNSYP